MSLIPMNTEQLRRRAIKNAEDRREQEQQYQAKVEQLSKHNVGGYFDLRTIKNSKSTKMINEKYYDKERIEEKFESFLGYHGLYKVRNIIEERVRKVNGGDLTVFGIEEEMKYLDDVLNEKEKMFQK
jgi:hypothetical protein